ncbi:MAG: class I SAM-dependent methyltransferase [Chloroflexi bacterium]|nr:class I SAM-dependent methyltransferase [Chloroflexota bacterium]
MTEGPRICDYGDSTYRQDFWEGQGRAYEDAVERGVLKQLLPAGGRRLLEIGAGYGRITDEYEMFEQVVLLDYSLEQLQYARAKFGDDGYFYVAANAYRMPFQPAVFDAATMIRVIHHFENVPAVLDQIRRVLPERGQFILEYANKRNLKAMLRHLLGMNEWNPYTPSPVEFVELNFNFHPDYMVSQVTSLGFDVLRVVPVSWFRLGLLKRWLPTRLLAASDALLQRSGWTIAPSVFLDLRLKDASHSRALSPAADAIDILRCPRSGAHLQEVGDTLIGDSGIRWAIRDGVYDFRQPLDQGVN